MDIANINTAQQIVIAGPQQSIKHACEVLTQAGAKRMVTLPVSGAFHSRYMHSAQQEFACYIRDFSFAALQIPVIANVTAMPYEADKVSDTLVQQMASPVRWLHSIRFVLRQQQVHFEELGPGKVLSGLLRRIQSS